MSFEWFIARRIENGREGEKSAARTAVRIATVSSSVAMFVMTVAIAVIVGFKGEIRDKVVGFNSHFQISAKSGRGENAEGRPIAADSAMVSAIEKVEGVSGVYQVCALAGIIKTEDEVHGIVMKGVGEGYDWTFLGDNIERGRIPVIRDDSVCKEVMLSRRVADRMGIDTAKAVFLYFVVDGKVRARKMNVCGIYNTGFTEFDDRVVIGDIKQTRRLMGYDSEEVTNIEVRIKDFGELEEAEERLFKVVGNRFDKNGNPYNLASVVELQPHLFSWLDMLDMNVVIIMVLMTAVAVFSIISALLIRVLENTQMIGLLYALGAETKMVQKVFMYQSLMHVGKSVIIGNVIGILLCALQDATHILKLDAETYYVDFVPVCVRWTDILMLDAGMMLVAMVVLSVATMAVKRISPAEAMRFE